jgi:Tfp pilus assembly protein PilZ
MEGTEKRQAPRISFREPVAYELPRVPTHGGCLACDISESGLRINLNDFVPLDEEVNFQIQLETDEPFIDVTGRVVWVHQVPFSERYQVGVEFMEDGSYPQSKERIHEYIHSHRVFS